MQLEKNKIKVSFLLSKYENSKGYCIYLYKDSNTGEKVTCTGNYLPKYSKINYEMTGSWKNTEKYGMNFSVDSYQEIVEDNKESIISYLSSGIIPGIGIKTAEKIFTVYGNESMDILLNEPDRLLEIKGITKNKIQKIKDSIKQHVYIRNLTEFLLPYGFTSKQICNIYNQLGIKNPSTILKNPYELIKIHGITVNAVDIIAQKNGYPMDSNERLLAHSLHVLMENETYGHTGMEATAFGIALLNSLRCREFTKYNISQRVIELIKSGHLICKKIEKNNQMYSYIFRPSMYRKETELAQAILQLASAEQKAYENISNKITNYCKELNLILDEGQENALRQAITNSVLVITGGPGTGKTTLLKALAHFLSCEESDRKIYFMAPSGRAARRITESTHYPATTIHQALSIRPDESVDTEKIFKNATVIVDEFSMVETDLARMLIKSIKHGSRLIIVGDKNQLQSVGPGAVLRDIINSHTIPVAELTQIHRQNESSKIYENSQKIIKGQHDIEEGSDFRIIQSSSAAEAQQKMVDSFVDYARQHGVENVYCLCPCKDREAGVKIMNVILQEKINPISLEECEISTAEYKFRVGDPVMHLKNGEEVSNGDIGYVCAIKENKEGKRCIYVTYFGDTIIEYSPEQYEDITLAYALTVHKIQGCENKKIITYLSCSNGKNMLKRNLLNTAITRASEELELYATQDNAIDIAIDNDDSENRITSLQYQLELYYGKFVRIA